MSYLAAQRGASLGIALAILFSASDSSALTVTLWEFTAGGAPQGTKLRCVTTNYLQGGGQTATFEPEFLPFVDSHRAEVFGAICETSYTLDNSELLVDIVEHARPRRAETNSAGTIYFMVDEDVQFELSGEYLAIGYRWVNLEATLFEFSTSTQLFDNQQTSRGTLDESFQLGEASGDYGNRLSGSLTGTLYANDAYRLMYAASLRSTGAGDTSASASGFIRLGFAPEPPAVRRQNFWDHKGVFRREGSGSFLRLGRVA